MVGAAGLDVTAMDTKQETEDLSDKINNKDFGCSVVNSILAGVKNSMS